MKKPYLSVIVPVHNGESFMRKGLDSIRSQVYDDYELIVVCDNCQDKSVEIAREYADKVIVTQFGLDGLARNAGLDEAEGECVLFMDHDDWFLHEFAFLQCAEMMKENPDADMLVFSFIWKGFNYIDARKRMVIAVWSKCWRRAFIGETRFSDRPYWSDVDFHKKIMEKKPRAYMWDRPMYYYNYLMPGSTSWREKEGLIESYQEQERRKNDEVSEMRE